MVYRIDTGWQARKRRIVFNETALQNPRFLTSEVDGVVWTILTWD